MICGCRRTQNIQILNTRTLGKPCGSKAGIIHHGWSPNWQYWTWEWVLLMNRKLKWPNLLPILISHLIRTDYGLLYKLFPNRVITKHICKDSFVLLPCIVCKLTFGKLDCDSLFVGNQDFVLCFFRFIEVSGCAFDICVKLSILFYLYYT